MTDQIKQEPQLSSPQDSSGPTNATPEVKDELSKVAINPKRNLLVAVSMLISMGVMAYNLLLPLFITAKKDSDPEFVPIPKVVSTPSSTEADIPPIPQVPEPPKLVDPNPPPPPPIKAEAEAPLPPTSPLPQAMPPIPMSSSKPAPVISDVSKDAEAAKQRAEAKRKSSIVLVAGAPINSKTDIEKSQETDFKKRGDLEYVLGQGKVIDAVVESAINSDFVGEIRAVISRDVYAENGKNILIPKGTRVFGAFSVGDATTGRISVTWNKINLETGYTLTIASQAVDNLGRLGVQGRVDNKYTEQMTNAVLTSAFNIAIASGLDKLVPPVTATATASQTSSAVSSLTTLATGIASDPNTSTPPTYPVQNNDGGATAKIAAICAQGKSLITDVTSTTYTQLTLACTTAQAPTGGTTPQQALTSLVATVTGLATSTAQAAVANATPTQTQDASKQAFTDITSAAKNMVAQTTFTPTVTIDQGTKIKIYVNKDYVFPKDAISKSKVVH